jgi:exodeoxyribonuclease VII large subunit
MRNHARLIRQQVGTLAGRLDSLSPLAVLGRGYSVTQREADGTVIVAADQISPGERIRTRLAAGELLSRVEKVNDAPRDLATNRTSG